ncbi:MAG: potassium-transporting ATPase subunit KdpC, partial [Planctomycetota bacterium]|nr:potassium-transporting ATPase subunit KdpC [Planctomycetota bacterium]
SHTAPEYFWGRPSATAPMPANGMASGGSNQGPTNPALLEAVRDRCARLREADPDNTEPIPVDLVTASASGLDPEISPAAALYQAKRVARATGLSLKTVQQLIARHIEPPTLGFLGQPRVNVLELNLDLRRTREQPAH